MYSDAHLHYDEALQAIWEQTPITSIISCTTIAEAKKAKALCESYPFLHMSCGIHPWNCDEVSWEEMQEWLVSCDIIGEIGMDTTWCEKPLDVQRIVFEQQLAYACDHRKPVILHTKGQEETIAHLIAKYPNTYMVHWYSCMEYLDLYKELNCYFSVGPDLKDPAVQQVIKQIDISHLLIETDGIAAIAWAQNKAMEQIDYRQTLTQTIIEIAKHKQLDEKKVEDQTYENLLHFMND